MEIHYQFQLGNSKTIFSTINVRLYVSHRADNSNKYYLRSKFLRFMFTFIPTPIARVNNSKQVLVPMQFSTMHTGICSLFDFSYVICMNYYVNYRYILTDIIGKRLTPPHPNEILSRPCNLHYNFHF